MRRLPPLLPNEQPDSTHGSATATPSFTRGASAQTISLATIAILAVFYTLSVAADVILPFLLAVVLNLLLQPVMRLLRERLYLPSMLAALVVIVLLFGLIASVGAAISVPAASWLARAPESLPKLQEQLRSLSSQLNFLQHGMEQVQHLIAQGWTSPAGLESVAAPAAAPGAGAASSASPDFSSMGLSLVLGTQHFFGRAFMLLVVLYFLLAAGDSLLRNLVDVMPHWNDKRRVVVIANEIERNVSGYLVTITGMNLAVGVLNGVATWACGMPNPLLWGTLAFLLNYIPILGPVTGMVIFFFVGLFTFSTIWVAFLPPAIYLLIHVMEGETITPMLLARRFTLNPVIVIVSLFFWDWIWGIPGALLSVPLLAIFKIICDNIPRMAPLGHMLAAARHPARPGAKQSSQ